MIDLVAASSLAALALLVLVAYGVALALRGHREIARVTQEGSSALLGRHAMEATHWALDPLGRACVRAGVSANQVTGASLVVGAAAGVALGTGHWGVGGALAAISALGDTLDGIVARAANTASDAGETLDAAVDRYNEFFFLVGVACALRESTGLLLLTLGALLASFMVSYATAKAEALHVTPPRGAMRRAERATYLTFGALLVPIVALFAPAYALVPAVLALALVATVGNVSAVRRLARIMTLAHGARAEAP